MSGDSFQVFFVAVAFTVSWSTPPTHADPLARALNVASPDGSIELRFELRDGTPTYSVQRRGEALIRSSKLGFLLVDAPPLDGDFIATSSERRAVSNTWEQPWGQKRRVRCELNELRVALRQVDPQGRRLVIVFRVFDDGVGFRYEWPEQPNLTNFEIADELTEFVFADDASAWWIPAYQPEHYEYLYRQTPLSQIPKAHTPATFELPDGTCMSIHEAALVDFASMVLVGAGGTTLKADLVPWSDGVKVKATAPHRSPWRTIQIADDAAGLITSDLILNLNEPSRIKDVTWIKPGKYVGIWWEMHLDKSTWSNGPRHGATTANARRYIDFAARNGFDGVLVEGWNKGWDGDWIKHGEKFSFTEPSPDYDLEGLAHYAREKGVRLIGHHETGGVADNYERQLEDAFALYERLGIRAVKTGYVNFANRLPRIDKHGKTCGEWHYGQYMVRHHQKVIEAAARHHLMLDVHEPIKPTGLCRTWPNLMTAEGARGQEYNAWSPDGGNPPEHETILPFTRLLAGPMDFTPGIFDLTYPEYRPKNRVNTTLAKQLALYVVIYSPLHMAADLPENYALHDDALQFIRDVPTDWEDTRVLEARIGDCLTIVRRARGGDDWFLGSVTDEHGRLLETPLSFLDPDRRYTAEIYRDDDDADWESRPSAYKIESRDVDARTVLHLRLAPGGGQAIRFRAADVVKHAKSEHASRMHDRPESIAFVGSPAATTTETELPQGPQDLIWHCPVTNRKVRRDMSTVADRPLSRRRTISDVAEQLARSLLALHYFAEMDHAARAFDITKGLMWQANKCEAYIEQHGAKFATIGPPADVVDIVNQRSYPSAHHAAACEACILLRRLAKELDWGDWTTRGPRDIVGNWDRAKAAVQQRAASSAMLSPASMSTSGLRPRFSHSDRTRSYSRRLTSDP